MVDWFVSGPVAITLLTISLCLFGIMDYVLFPIADMPNIDFPVIQMWALQSGEHRALNRGASRRPSRYHCWLSGDDIPVERVDAGGDVLSRDITCGARDDAAAIQAIRADLSTVLRQNATCYFKVNPNDPSELIFALISHVARALRSGLE
ncbi:MAG: hypothetical protein SOH81_01355 [Acetobacter sp.]|jgi:multidrug efflux pump